GVGETRALCDRANHLRARPRQHPARGLQKVPPIPGAICRTATNPPREIELRLRRHSVVRYSFIFARCKYFTVSPMSLLSGSTRAAVSAISKASSSRFTDIKNWV